MGEIPSSVRRLAEVLALQMAEYDRLLTAIDRACGRYSAQIRYLELEPGIEQSRHALQQLRRRATELGPDTLSAFDAVAATANPDRWKPSPEDLLRQF